MKRKSPVWLVPEPQMCVYRLYDADGNALYIGHTRNIEQRLKGHRSKSKAWFCNVVSWTHTPLMPRSQALPLELAEIEAALPKHNIFGAPMRVRDMWNRRRAGK